MDNIILNRKALKNIYNLKILYVAIRISLFQNILNTYYKLHFHLTIVTNKKALPLDSYLVVLAQPFVFLSYEVEHN